MYVFSPCLPTFFPPACLQMYTICLLQRRLIHVFLILKVHHYLAPPSRYFKTKPLKKLEKLQQCNRHLWSVLSKAKRGNASIPFLQGKKIHCSLPCLTEGQILLSLTAYKVKGFTWYKITDLISHRVGLALESYRRVPSTIKQKHHIPQNWKEYINASMPNILCGMGCGMCSASRRQYQILNYINWL